MNAADCLEDLLVRERQGALGADERRALDAHAAECPLCRMSRFVGAAIEPLPPITAVDDLRAARIVAGALAVRVASSMAPRAQRPRRRVGKRLAVAAALLFLVGSASAAWWHWAAERNAPSLHERATHSAAGAGRRHPHGVNVPQPPEPASPAPPEPSAPPPPAGSLPTAPEPSLAPPAPSEARSGPGAGAAPALAPEPRSEAGPGLGGPRALAFPPGPATAPGLFAAANRSRGARSFAKAVRLYRTLQTRFPGSPEANLSFLSLGELYATRGQAVAALAQFDDYLASRDGALVEEALVGRARMLRELGRTGEEMSTWRQLLARFPQSDYRWRAQQRLAGPNEPP